MKWLIGGLLVWYFLSQQSTLTAAPASTPMTNQTGGNPINTVVQQVSRIATDITGEPTTPANNSVGVATPNAPPNFQTGAPRPALPLAPAGPMVTGKYEVLV